MPWNSPSSSLSILSKMASTSLNSCSNSSLSKFWDSFILFYLYRFGFAQDFTFFGFNAYFVFEFFIQHSQCFHTQIAAQILLAIKQSAFDGADAHIHDVGNFGITELFFAKELQRFTLCIG